MIDGGANALKLTVRRRILRGGTAVADRSFGVTWGNRVFWTMPGIDPSWPDVRDRVDHLISDGSGTLEDFVAATIGHTSNPTVVLRLARYPASKEAFTRWLAAGDLHRSRRVTANLRRNGSIGGALISAARLLTPADEAAAIRDRVIDSYDAPPRSLFQTDASAGWNPPAVPDPRSRSAHRLIICETFPDDDAVALLIPGAERTTLFAASDTYGQADFDGISHWAGVGDVVVEHLRTRITRFSAAYIELHEAVRDRAIALTRSISEIDGLIHPDDKPFLEVKIADFLFFQALRLRAIRELVSDPQFDHIVVALDRPAIGTEFMRLLHGIDELSADPRVEFVSVADATSHRGSFWSLVDAFASGPRRAVERGTQLPDAVLGRKLRNLSEPLAENFGTFDSSTGRSVLMATANNPAYVGATAAYLEELDAGRGVRLLHIGANATALVQTLGAVADRVPIDFLAPSGSDFEQMASHLAIRLQAMQHDDAASALDTLVEHTLTATTWRLARGVVVDIAGFHAVRAWFARLERSSRLPAVVVITPQRNASVSQLAAVARAHKVPSIALEPHAQDANYSRYTKVVADYYGVMSDYFRRHAADGFSIDIDRVRAIGSPRQVAPTGYDPNLARRRARSEFKSRFGIDLDDRPLTVTFFTQPAQWEHASKVWSNILDAACRTGARVLLKPHPETSPTTINHYLATAAGDVVILDCDASTAVALSDIALTAYSSAAIDAAVRQTPVICVTDGPVDYPLDMGGIVDAPTVRSADELAEQFAAFVEDPTEFLDRARNLLSREPQFVHGPGPGLRRLVDDAIRAGEGGIRSSSELPASMFLDGPHPRFSV